MLAKSLIDRGAKLDGIGLQFHFFSDNALRGRAGRENFHPARHLQSPRRLRKTGQPIHVTEITIPTSRGEEAQAYFARQAYRLFFSHPAVEAITWWNMRDGQAASNEAHLMGGLIKDDLTPKASYRALEQLIAKDWQTNVSYDKPTKSAHFEASTECMTCRTNSRARNTGKKSGSGRNRRGTKTRSRPHRLAQAVLLSRRSTRAKAPFAARVR